MLHVLRHDEWLWHWQKAATLYNQKNDKYIAIRATYYIFCCRNRNGDRTDLMQFWFLFFSFFSLSFFFFFFLNNPISSSFCKLPLHNEICNCTFKNTNKVSNIIIIYFFFPFLSGKICHRKLACVSGLKVKVVCKFTKEKVEKTKTFICKCCKTGQRWVP